MAPRTKFLTLPASASIFASAAFNGSRRGAEWKSVHLDGPPDCRRYRSGLVLEVNGRLGSAPQKPVIKRRSLRHASRARSNAPSGSFAQPSQTGCDVEKPVPDSSMRDATMTAASSSAAQMTPPQTMPPAAALSSGLSACIRCAVSASANTNPSTSRKSRSRASVADEHAQCRLVPIALGLKARGVRRCAQASRSVCSGAAERSEARSFGLADPGDAADRQAP
jgi:hypothetical protein